MPITEICIENIRGFGKESLQVNLLPNFVSFIVAPNGFGKTSISTAFFGARGRTLKIDTNDTHKFQDNVPSVLQIEVDGVVFRADPNKNEISQHFDVHVIKSYVQPQAKLPRFQGITVARPYLEIPDIDLGPARENPAFDVEASELRTELGSNAKLAPSLDQRLGSDHLRAKLFPHLSEIDKLKQTAPTKLLSRILEFARDTPGTKDTISAAAEQKFSQDFNNIPSLKKLYDSVATLNADLRWLQNVLLVIHIANLANKDRAALKKWLEYGQHKIWISSLKTLISDINGSWMPAKIKEKRERVVVEMPEVKALSNGQRDILYFASSLLRVKFRNNSKPCILFIDEIFDYLDDANILVAQYYLSNLITEFRKNGNQIYICLLTHLDPAFFRGYALKKQKSVYLGVATQSITETMKRIILDRENPTWSDVLSSHFLHYNPERMDISHVFNTNFGLPKIHGINHDFYDFLQEHWQKCKSQTDGYDPFAVCAFVRVQIERRAFEKINDAVSRQTFLNTRKTREKLDFVSECGVDVPEVCFLLAGLYNEALHKKHELQESSSIALKLKNLALQGLISNAVEW